ncbi:hypothetical protein ACHAWO_001994 [Cyclotella atomus]|uniref:PNPLA domain-containing protein n=1 Tax=Cyclotella atomus TaxID=382360 RepID=A0ABD3NGV8_9STRA
MGSRPFANILRRFSSATSPNNDISFGFSGAGFLGCYHVGVAACLHRQGILPNPNDSSNGTSPPLVTGVSAGSMIAAAVLAGVQPDPDGMEVVLEAARKTRALAKSNDFNVSLDVLTPGFSLIDQVEEPFQVSLVKALGGRIPEKISDQIDDSNVYDIDPNLFQRRFPDGSLRLGLTDRRVFGPRSILESYRYVDSFRNVDDIIATCMLSSYIPGGTGPLHLHDKMPEFLIGLFGSNNNSGSTARSVKDNTINDTVHRAGTRLREIEAAGLVKHGRTGLPVLPQKPNQETELDQKPIVLNSTDFWDGGIADVFPTFDDRTIIIAPVNGFFSNPAICPMHSADEVVEEVTSQDSDGKTSSATTAKKPIQLQLQTLIRTYIPKTFRHCNKAELGLNNRNAKAVLKMAFSSEDEELYQIFRDGYDDAR